MTRKTLPRKPRGHMRFQWRLVLAESRVSVNPVHRFLRRGDELGREATKVRRELRDHVHHRPADALVVMILPRLEPLAVVVAFKRTKEANCLRRKVRTHLAI